MGTYRIVVTDFRGNLLFTITDSDFVSLEIIDQLNDAGSWKLRSRTKEPCPFSACNAIIVFRDDVQIYNGYVTKIEETYEVSSKTWNWTVKGENHIGLLKHRLIYPTKNNDGTLRDQYYRMSPARPYIWIRGLITDNACENENQQYPAKEHVGLWFVAGATEMRSYPDMPAIRESYRFDNLHESIYAIAAEHQLGIYAVTDPETYRVWYYIKKLQDKTDSIVFSDTDDDLTYVKRFTNAPETYSYVTSYNADIEEDGYIWHMWPYVEEGKDAGDWGDLFRETFCEPNKEEFITSYSDDDPVYTWTRTQLYNIAWSYARKGHKDTQGIEFGIDTLGKNLVYGYDVEDPSSDPDWFCRFTNDYQLGDIIRLKVFGETIDHMIMQMKISVSYGREEIVPSIGAAMNGSFTELLKAQKRTSNDLNRTKNREIPS